MRCTACSAPVTPVVAVDIDGTLGDYHRHLRDFAASWLGTDDLPEQPYPYTMEFSDWLGIEKSTYRQIKLAYRQGGMKRTMPVFEGASDLVNTLRHLRGVEVWFATTRPWDRLDNVDPDTREWLRRNGMEPTNIIYGEDKYQQLVRTIDKERIVAVLDDLPEQIDEARNLGLPTLHRVQWHALPQRREPYITNLTEALRITDERILEWRSTTAFS